MGGIPSVKQIGYTNTSSAPTTTYRSDGTKLVLYDNISAYSLDCSIGVEPYNMILLLVIHRVPLNPMAVLIVVPL